MLDEQRQILGALAQRRKMQRDHVQPIVEVRSKGSLAHRLFQVAIGGGDDADVDVDALLAADAHELALLDDAQELGLKRRRQLAHLVEKDRALIRQLELSELPL